MVLDGFEVAGFRSFGSEPQRCSDLERVNVILGPNNAGKSNLLRFCLFLSTAEWTPGEDPKAASEDRPLDAPSTPLIYGYQLRRESPATGKAFDAVTSRIAEWLQPPHRRNELWLRFQEGMTWTATDQPAVRELAAELSRDLGPTRLEEMSRHLTMTTGGGENADAARVAHKLVRSFGLPFKARIIGPFRRISAGHDPGAPTGAGLIQKLRQLQSPRLESKKDAQTQLASVRRFIREVLQDDSAELSVPAETDELYVTLRGKELRVEQLGTGIHEVVILASEVALATNMLILIEEPEIHLHPSLQRRLVKFLQETSNQYIIASHSNAFIDMEGVKLYRCYLENGQSRVVPAAEDQSKVATLDDLGYRPSDLLQANYVLWVEGPSDRIYIRHWIRLVAPDLIEGLHFSIMFYGGRLLCHVAHSVAQATTDFIALARLSQHCGIVIDSDRSQEGEALNQTKTRVLEEFRSRGAFTWVTWGRAIENYLSSDEIQGAVGAPAAGSWDQYTKLEDVLPGAQNRKVELARRHRDSEHAGVAGRGDLEEQVDGLISAIRASSDLKG